MSYTPTEWESTDVVTATRLNALEQAVGDLNMSYTPNVWQNGDVLTADKMNALEQAVASGGGGGSSDFSTAQVTVTISNENVEWIAMAHTDNDEYYGEMSFGDILGSGSGTYSVILYKGQALGVIHASVPPFMLNVSTTGDIEYDDDIIVSGDGTITIS